MGDVRACKHAPFGNTTKERRLPLDYIVCVRVVFCLNPNFFGKWVKDRHASTIQVGPEFRKPTWRQLVGIHDICTYCTRLILET